MISGVIWSGIVRCSITDMSVCANRPPLNAAIGVQSATLLAPSADQNNPAADLLAACDPYLPEAAQSASTRDSSACTRPAGMVVSPLISFDSASRLSSPETSHMTWRALASAG